MDKDVGESRFYGSAPFKAGEVDAEALKRALRERRPVDAVVLRFVPLGAGGLDAVPADAMVAALNKAVESDFYLHVLPGALDLSQPIARLLKLAHESRDRADAFDPELVCTLNRALIHAVYAAATTRSRRHERFSVPESLETAVTLRSIDPAGADVHDGTLLNISAGGMALLLPVSLPNETYWALRLTVADCAELETLVQIRHSLQKNDGVLHGFQFVSIAEYVNERVAQAKKSRP